MHVFPSISLGLTLLHRVPYLSRSPSTHPLSGCLVPEALHAALFSLDTARTSLRLARTCFLPLRPEGMPHQPCTKQTAANGISWWLAAPAPTSGPSTASINSGKLLGAVFGHVQLRLSDTVFSVPSSLQVGQKSRHTARGSWVTAPQTKISPKNNNNNG